MFKLIAPLVAVLVLVVGCVSPTSSYHTLETGHYGVIIHYGQNGAKPTFETVQTGVGVWVNFWRDAWVDYPNAQQSLTMVRNVQEGQVKGDDSIACHDQNGVPYNLDVTVTWRVDPGHVGDLYLLRPDQPLVSDPRNPGNDIQTTVVRRIARSVIPVACGGQTYTEIYTSAGKLKLQADGLKLLQQEAAKEFVEIDGLYPGEVYLQAAQQDAISKTANAQAAVAQAAQLQQQAINEAQGVVAKAQGEATAEAVRANADAQQAVTKASAEATVTALQATSQARANEIINPTLNQNVLQDEQIKRWNGQLPEVSGNASPLIQVPSPSH